MHCSERSLFEWHRYKLLRVHIVEPIGEWTVRSSKHLLVLIYSLLITFIVVGRCQSRNVSEIREWMLTPAFPCIYGRHRASFIYTLCLVSQRDEIVRCLLEVEQALLVAYRLLIMSIWGLIRPISLLLNLGEQPRSGTLRPKYSFCLVTLWSHRPKIRGLSIGVEFTCYLEKVLFYIPLDKLARCWTLTICCHCSVVAINILCIFVIRASSRCLT